MFILGLNGAPIGWHDAAACLIDGDGRVLAMAEEERFTRKKHSPRANAVNAAEWCLAHVGITPADLDAVSIGWDLARLMPRFGGDWNFAAERTFLRQRFGWTFGSRQPEVICTPHHLAHAASTFYASGYESAAVLVNDGNGEDESISIYEARAGLPLVRRRIWPRSHSLGYLYQAASEAIGLTFLEAGKTMGLASFGRAARVEPRPLLRTEGKDFEPPFDLDPSADWDEVVGAWAKVFAEFGTVPRTTSTADLADDEVAVAIAWSAQATIERMVPALVAEARAITGLEAVCLAGGVALNCSTNGQLAGPVYVPPVPHDAGVALGAAWSLCPPAQVTEPMSAYLGPPVGPLTRATDGWTCVDLDVGTIADRLVAGEVGAVAAGPMEVGPRALGHRSIIALPSDTEVRDRVNRMKGRELWRPLAPIGLSSAEGRYWRGNRTLQAYMLGAAEVTEQGRDHIAATVHVDGTARAQIADDIGLTSDILRALDARGLPPVLINTSFNTRGEPVVCSADDALRSAETIGLDFVVIGDDLMIRDPKTPPSTGRRRRWRRSGR